MAHSHFKILGVTADTDNDGNPRIRAQVQEYKPRSFNCTLTKADAHIIEKFKSLVGGDAMIPGREGRTNDGISYFILDTQQEIIPIHEPEKITASNVVEVVSDPIKETSKQDMNNSQTKKPLFANQTG